ncbi:HAD family hydrolase, partial [bacterium]
MSLTLLLDMDDTLLVNDMDRFLPVYLQKLATHLQDSVSPDQMILSLIAGTRAMVHKQMPGKTLESTFDEIFYAGIKGTKEQFAGQLNDFYARVYPDLKSVTAPMPGAVNFVEWAFAQGYTVAIATNPLFPRTAIEQRLEWAGLSLSKYPFALVTSFESLHYAKPNPAYYAEILAQLAWPEQPVAMVGNSLTDDIQPARAIGLSA